MKKPYRNLSLSLLTVALLGACASIPSDPQSGNALYTSSYALDAKTVGSYELSALSVAPRRKDVLIHFDKPSSEIFLPLLSEVNLYDDSIETVTFDHSASQTPGKMGVGSVRICTFKNGKQLYEPLVVYEPSKFYAYTIDKERSTMSLPIEDVVLFYSFEDKAQETSLVTVRAHFNVKNAALAPFVTPAFGNTLKKTFASAADVFGGRLVDHNA